jgi:D-galactarolactone cycloisomerase
VSDEEQPDRADLGQQPTLRTYPTLHPNERQLVLFAASIHVAMAAPNCHILEVTQGYMPMMWDLFNEPFDIRPDGMVHAPNRAGLGFTLRADALEQFRYVDGPEFEF